MQVNIDHIGYGERILVRDIAFTVAPGECLLLAGHNGSGKSTLLRVLAGETCVSPTVASRPLPPRRALQAQAVGPSLLHGRGWPWVCDTQVSPVRCIIIPTGIPKVKGFTVREFVRTGCYRESDWAGRLRKETEERLEESLEQLGLKPLADRDIASLSDGEFQKACIAVGLTRRADLLLLDEPTAFLDVENRLMVLRTLREVAEQTGTAVIFSSHDLHDALAASHRVLAITPDGRLLESGKENREAILKEAFPAWDY